MTRSSSLAGSVRPGRRDAFETALKRLAPLVPRFECGAIVDHALDSSGLRAARPETAAWLSLVAYVRHARTDYDALLNEGYDLESARYFVRDAINDVLRSWGVRRQLTDVDPA